jgi:hypothetical protein
MDWHVLQNYGLIANMVIAFTCTAVLDWAWAKYTHALVERRAIIAASWATMIYLLGGAVVLLYVATPWALLSAAAGGFAGTYLALKFGKPAP